MKVYVIYGVLCVWAWFSSVSVVQAQFTDDSENMGLQHIHISDQLMGGGVALFDSNGDGLMDIYTTGGQILDKLYINAGNGRFIDESDVAGITGLTGDFETFGVVVGDINNDGCRDLFVSTLEEEERNILLLNGCDGTYSDITESAGILEKASSTSATFFDYNKDSFLDLYVINYIDEPKAIFDNEGQVIGFEHKCFDNFMYVNNGDNTFTEVSVSMGMNDGGCGLAVVGTDYDQDGDQDIYVANDFGEWVLPNILYRNNYPENTFTDVSAETGMDIGLYGMGIAIGDYDHDSDFDYYVTNLGRNYFMKNDGDNVFADVAAELNVQNERGLDGMLTTGWGTFFIDHDNDADLDLFVSNGFIPAAPFIGTTILDENVLYQNNNEQFTDIAPEYGFNNQNINRGIAYGDFDNDGYLDVFLPSLGRSVTFENPQNFLPFINEGLKDNNWSQVKLEGDASNRDAIGSLVHLYAGEVDFVQELYSGGTHASQNSEILQFGLSKIEKIDSITVQWPSGSLSVFKNVPLNQRLYILEGSGNVEIMGCTDENSPNYNPDATKSIGCFKQEFFGCTDATALNYDEAATIDDESCEYKVVTGYNDDVFDDEIQIGPVPFNNQLRLSFPESLGSKSLKVQIFDIDGKTVAERTINGLNEFNWRLGQLQIGMYLLRISTEGQVLKVEKVSKRN